MNQLLSDLALLSAQRFPDRPCLAWQGIYADYATVCRQAGDFASGLLSIGMRLHARVGIYLPKRPEAVISILGTALAGCVFVPINPLLRPSQVGHILRDCNIELLVTASDRLSEFQEVISESNDLGHIVDVFADPQTHERLASRIKLHRWGEFIQASDRNGERRTIDADGAAIFYTSGSTGKPKGVVLSHANMVSGAASVAQYLENRPEDRLLALLPLSFDYGFSQLSTALSVGASVVLNEYLLPGDVPNLVSEGKISGLAGVPSLWNKLADLAWPTPAQESLRYITNSGGKMAVETQNKLRKALPKTQLFLMYGLTEAFRSTYLHPTELDRRPHSIGKAIPNAEILVVRPDGTPSDVDEPGELVHRGALVALGYWNDPVTTATRFKPIALPGWMPGRQEIAVWSGDIVKRDKEGFLYFVSRSDEMIKTSGYRVSPSEVEEALFSTGLVSQAVVFGIPQADIGQAIAAIVVPAAGVAPDEGTLLSACRKLLPLYMIPTVIEWRDELPRNPNGKYDRAALRLNLMVANRR